MRVLFVGATGVIGRQVVPVLAESFDLKLAAREAGRIADIAVQQCDIRDYDQVETLVRDVDAVVNCAIETPRRTGGKLIDDCTPDEIMQYNHGAIDVNTRGAYHLYEAAARQGIRKFVFISSMTAVMGHPKYERIPEEPTARASNFYACTKLFGEQLGAVYSNTTSLEVICLRLGQPYPSMTYFDNLQLLSPTERGLMVAVQDVAQAMRCALESEAGPGIYPVLSESDSAWVDTSVCRQIGYSPNYLFDKGGIRALVPA